MNKVELVYITPNAAQKIESIACVCYDSEPTDDCKIFKGCMKSGHCFDKETEVLTDKGFVKWRDVSEETKLAVVNPQNREFVGFEKPINLISYLYDGDMISFQSRSIDLVVTPQHKLYCSLSTTSQLRTNPIFELREANEIITSSKDKNGKELYKKPLRLVTSAINNKHANGNPWFKLYGFFIGDGSCESTQRIRFHLKKERKIEYLKDIANECGVNVIEGKSHHFEIEIQNHNFKDLFYNSQKEKTFPDCFYLMTAEDFNNFYEGLINSDGNIGKTDVAYSTSSEELKDKLSALFSINGLAFTVWKYEKENQNWKTSYQIRILQKDFYPMFNDSRTNVKPNTIKYNDMVYCAQVSTGLLVVRRNNKVCLCGNCSVAEHSDITFKVTCSRACSHQLVRHRTNKYTQRSQRYCKEDGFEYYTPDSIKGKDDANRLYDAIMKQLQAFYDMLVSDYDIPAEDARYVLPNACETVLYITMDFRNFFHFLNERLCTRAQKEIRDIAKEMARLAVEACPIIKPYCVPKCESFSIAYCPEHKGCGRHKPLKEIVRDEYK